MRPCWPRPVMHWNGPNRRLRWGWRCAASRTPPSTCPTGCCKTWATSWPPAGWALAWNTPGCRRPRPWRA
ncbi:hypothetical protein G6F40_018245 [Rhizopus arrhizus]|nr:hypothetical protein G6F40_018245 [Rhizopus arrhizus]